MELKINNLFSEDIKVPQKSKENISMPFSDFLKDSIYKVSDSQKYVEELDAMLVSGDIENLHDVSIAAEMANVNFLTLVNVKNKVMDAYREILRIQI